MGKGTTKSRGFPLGPCLLNLPFFTSPLLPILPISPPFPPRWPRRLNGHRHGHARVEPAPSRNRRTATAAPPHPLHTYRAQASALARACAHPPSARARHPPHQPLHRLAPLHRAVPSPLGHTTPAPQPRPFDHSPLATTIWPTPTPTPLGHNTHVPALHIKGKAPGATRTCTPANTAAQPARATHARTHARARTHTRTRVCTQPPPPTSRQNRCDQEERADSCKSGA